MKAMGHTDIKTTMIYVSLGKNHIREQVEKLTFPPETSPSAQGVSPVNTVNGKPLFLPEKAVVCAGFAVRSDFTQPISIEC